MKKFFLLIPFILVVVLASFFYFSLSAPNNDTTKKAFVINQGESLTSIATRLEKYHYINNRYVFIIYSRITALNQKIKAGTFYLTTAYKLPDLTLMLTKGGITDYWLKITEGQRLAELSVTFDSSLEGYIFPDTYLIPKDYQPNQIYTDIIKKNFDKKFAAAKVDVTNTQLTDAEVVTLASLLEREARTLPSKQMVAGILLNRLKIGIALQLDTTAEYARDSKFPPQVYWQEASSVDVKINSLYNTYLHPGLPPGPICNPGYDALYAAFHPTVSNYLYYLTGNDNLMHYAITLKDHNTNIAKYLK
jgi:UPF0755 protein